MIQFSFVQIAHFYVAMLFCFSVCLVFAAEKTSRKPTLIWIISNLVAGLAMEMFVVGELELHIHLRPMVFLLQGFAPFFKFLALAHSLKWPRIRWIVSGLMVTCLMIPLTIYQITGILPGPFIANFAAVSATAACIIVIIYNKYWKGFFSKFVMILNFILAIYLLFLRLLKSWQQETIFFLLSSKDEVIFVLTFLAIISFIGQMAFLLMLTSRTQYYAKIKQRREERVRARSVSLRWQNKEISRLLDEQRRLLQTLTHEVRQPINNAQAALQGIMSDLQPMRGNQKRALPVAIRIQGILDDITLSLSNAIVGATLVERGKGANLHDCEILSIAQLALLDCPNGVRERIVIDFPENDIFLAVDPILLRLALRNLLDNAAKFSPPETEIVFSISLDEERFGVLIAVKNCVESSFVFERDMVGRGSRGLNAEAKEGSGIGLYVVNEVARIHGTDMVIETSEPGNVTFGILLSE
ncbi:ATP-binding protein [Novosphingobium sp. PASSN1]|uniref:sensor histidine kinase n=1 Tax=Novosphingobium sp. PASSN1 TaxID=2015561 RepID=UPI000BD205D3|nr:ATP-binding protein [Novosphingobium sp. PASSN1]OYU34938.1 MAG: hypothetical protein CFE35_13750 [Novosphingobium sp. PASSN1]